MILDILKFLFFLFLKIIPKSKKVLVFGDRGGRRYADNSRHLFIYLHTNYKNFKCVWISKDHKVINYLREKKLRSYHPNSPIGLFYCLIAKYHIFNFVEDDIHKYITQFSNSILLWHGVLPKKLKSLEINTSYILKIIYKNLNKYFIYPEKKLAENIFERFPKNKYKLLISNLPRNLIFSIKDLQKKDYYRTTNEIKFLEELKKEKKHILGYFPTWRRDGLELFRDIKNMTELDKLDKVLRENNSIIIVKQHMNSDKKDNNILYNQKIENIVDYLKKLENFRFVNYEFDLNSILEICDVLISDYSGVILDYLYLNRPIVTYAPDYISFKKHNGFNLDPLENQFTYYAKDINDLSILISNFNNDKEAFCSLHQEKRNKVKNRVFPANLWIENIINLFK